MSRTHFYGRVDQGFKASGYDLRIVGKPHMVIREIRSFKNYESLYKEIEAASGVTITREIKEWESKDI